MRLDEKTFWRDFDAMAAIGATEAGGCERLSMSDEDMKARALLISMLKEEGFAVNEDETGAIWARMEGEDPDAAAVLTGSHIDTVRNGGKYDGLLGVMMSFQAMRQIKQAGAKHKRAIELVVFPTEESARFNFPTVGSKVLAGKVTPAKLKEMKDKDGISLHQALVMRGFDPDHPEKAMARVKNALSMTEVHIEQGPLLESGGPRIGVVSAIAAPTRFSMTIDGVYSHSGACPMHLRRDALAAAAEVILAAEKAGNEEAVYKTVAAATLCNVKNASLNVVPGCVEIAVDVRGIDKVSIDRCVSKIKAALEETCERRGVKGSFKILSSDDPTPMHNRMIESLKNSCEQNGIAYEVMPSGAGHDAMNIAAVIPAGMIFVPCREGISHNPAEEVEKADIVDGFAVLITHLLSEANS
ncbi:MAG: Zn-dependent hydrolase [Oscillospiraceae bacterium]|nr:Zn-dependent hydrolase [Oscillospiraceae bacterium]